MIKCIIFAWDTSTSWQVFELPPSIQIALHRWWSRNTCKPPMSFLLPLDKLSCWITSSASLVWYHVMCSIISRRKGKCCLVEKTTAGIDEKQECTLLNGPLDLGCQSFVLFLVCSQLLKRFSSFITAIPKTGWFNFQVSSTGCIGNAVFCAVRHNVSKTPLLYQNGGDCVFPIVKSWCLQLRM